MSFSAKVLADSYTMNASFPGHRITTLQLRYPRFIHAEFMTHRVFSRNASSSRAVPVKTIVDDILRDTAMPIHWGKNQPGMQAREENNNSVKVYDEAAVEYVNLPREQAWFKARDNAIELALCFNDAGYHKQIVNRILEPFSHINVVVTSTEWDNFFTLRNHPDAQPEIKVLAEKMKEAMDASTPVRLTYDDWHLPYITNEDYASAIDYVKTYYSDSRDYLTLFGARVKRTLVMMSVARCARVSYLTHDMKTPSIISDIELYNTLMVSQPLHASPAEHQAMLWNDAAQKLAPNHNLHGNFSKSFIQYRKIAEFSATTDDVREYFGYDETIWFKSY